jgi:kinetochore protein Spc24
MELDAQKFRIAKAARDVEEEGERLEGDLKGLRSSLERLDAEGPEGAERRRPKQEDATMLVPAAPFTQSSSPSCQVSASQPWLPCFSLRSYMLTTTPSLRLKLYRTLGVDFEPSPPNNPTVFDRVIIRNMAKGDVHVVNIDPKFSRFFYANYLWGAMEG